MPNYQEARVKLTNAKLSKLKYAGKNKTGTILRINKLNLSLSFRSVLDMIPFLWKLVHFRSVFCRTLRTVSLLMDGGIPAFTNILFLQKSFTFLLASAWFVIRYFSFVEQTVLVVFPDYSFVTTKSPIFFFICLQMVVFDNFQYDLIFNISE